MNGRFVDISGMIFGKLTAVSFSHVGEDSLAIWNCVCECGKTALVRGASLRKGNTRSCGCYKKFRINETLANDLRGRRFGRLVAIQDVGRKYGKVVWECWCDCGKVITAPAGDILQGKYISCGCQKDWSGSRNPKWRGGHPKIYPIEWNKKLRKNIRELDNHNCRFLNCGYNDLIKTPRLHVHHIDGNKSNCKDYNLISLCPRHHQFVEANNPDSFVEKFYLITGERR